jgi:hypothetical protein
MEVTVRAASQGRSLAQDWTKKIGVIASILEIVSINSDKFENAVPLMDSNRLHRRASKPRPRGYLPKRHRTEEVQAQVVRVFLP